jgi:hypothetical protein
MTDHLEDLDIDGKIILKWILEKQIWNVDWIHFTHNRDWWQDLVNAVTNLPIP